MKKRIFILLGFIILYAASIFGTYTFAKYREKIEGVTNLSIASWNILVNEEQINGKVELTNEITPVFEDNEFIKNTVFAPGSVGYYDILINPSDVDVAFSYEIIAEKSADSTISDLKVTGYTLNPNENVVITPYEEKIEGNISLDSEPVMIRFFITWDESDDSEMDNEADTTAITDENAKAVISNSISFTQTAN